MMKKLFIGLLISAFSLSMLFQARAERFVYNPFTSKLDKVYDKASDMTVDTGSFTHVLSASDTTIQSALNTLDFITASTSTAVTGYWDFQNGSIELPNSTASPATCTPGQVYVDTNEGSGSMFLVCESANTWVAPGGGGGVVGGSTAWDDIGDPDNDGAKTITFDNNESSILTGNNDAAVSFFTLQNSDADHTGGNMYLLDLDYSADDGDVDADFIKLQDSGGTVFTIQENGNTNIDGFLSVGVAAHETISVNGVTKEIQFGVHGDDVANKYVSYIDRASDTHSPTMVIARARGTHAAPTQVVKDDILGQIGFMGWDDTDNDLNFGARIKAIVHTDAGNNDLPGAIIFGVAPDGAAVPTDQITLYDGVLAPITDNDVDLGASGAEFKDGYFDGTLEADAITEGGTAVYNSTESDAVYGTIAGETWTGVHDFGGATSVEIPEGAAPTVDTSGEIGVDTSGPGQLIIASGTTARVFMPVEPRCACIENLTDEDDDMLIGSFSQAVTIKKAWCHYKGTGTTTATLTLHDGGDNALTVAPPIVCAANNATAVISGVTAGGGISAGESLEFDVTNTPDPETDEYCVCVEYEYDRQ